MNYSYTNLAIAMCIALGATACGGGSSSSSNDSNTQASTYSVSAKIEDTNGNIVKNALVCIDYNGNGVCDKGEKSITSGSPNGIYTFNDLTENEFYSKETIIAEVNKSSNLPSVTNDEKEIYSYQLNPQSSADVSQDNNSKTRLIYINPITRMVYNYSVKTNSTLESAQKAISSSLGVREELLNSSVDKSSPIFVFAKSLQETEKELTEANLGTEYNTKSIEDIQKSLDSNYTAEQISVYFSLQLTFNVSDVPNKKPIVDFNTEVIGCRTVKFINKSEDPEGDSLDFVWNFGDDTKQSTEQNPTHTYETTGTKEVILKAKDNYSSNLSKQKIVIDNQLCDNIKIEPMFSLSNDKKDSTTIIFTNVTQGDIASYEWDFGDGNKSAERSPTHTYANSGTYDVVLTVKDTSGNTYTSESKTVTIQKGLDNQIPTVSGNLNINGLTVNIVNTSKDDDNDVLTYSWESSDGYKTENKDFNHTFDKEGNYIVVLTVSDGKASANKKFYVSVSDEKYLPKINVLSNNNLEVSLSATYENVSENAIYVWSFGDGSKEVTGQKVNHTYSKQGNYTITLTVSNGDDIVEKTLTISVSKDNVAPIAKYNSTSENTKVSFKDESSDANGDALTYLWDFGDGTTSTEANPIHNYVVTKETTFIVKLTVSDGKDSNTYTNSIKVSPTNNNSPIANFTYTIDNQTVKFTQGSTDPDGDELTYTWDFGDGITSNEKNPIHTYTVPANSTKSFTVKLTANDGKLSNTKTALISISDGICVGCGLDLPPSVDFHYSFTGLSGVLTAVASDPEKKKLTYSWDFGDGLTSSSKVAKITYLKGGKKKVVLTVSDGFNSVKKEYTFELENINIPKPEKQGLYIKTNRSHIHLFTNNQNFTKWPGIELTTATEDSSWKYIDTSAYGVDKISFVLNDNGQSQDHDVKDISATGCYDGTSLTPLDECMFGDPSTLKVVEGGCELGDNDDVLINDIEWNKLDYASYTSTSDVFIESAPFVITNLAPGSYHENKTVTLNLEDASREMTDGVIHYTLDNTVPDENSPIYDGKPIELTDTSDDGLGTAYRLRTLAIGSNGLKQEQHFFWFIKTNATVAPATDFRDETIYFVVTARYYDGDSTNNYHCRDRFDATDPSWRGDFKGLIEKLDYIKGMGFTAIWITPPVENRSGLDYHGYHAYDWFQPDLRLESKDATYFDFIKAAHAKGIKVIQDVVLNHSSNYGIRGQAYIEKIPTKYHIDAEKGKDNINYGPYTKNVGDYLSSNRCDNDNPVAPIWHRMLCAGDPEAHTEFTVKFKNGSVNVNNTSTKNIPTNYFWSPAIASYLPEKWYHVGYT
ncbi:MAG: PKD domain-containing protein, partial [Succinivibrionaceae bacterium]